MAQIKLSRRQFLIGTAVIGTGLALRFNSNVNAAQIFSPDMPSDDFATSDTWIHISTDNIVTIKIPSSEMGQGIHTGLAAIVADELDADWDLIKIQQAPFSSEFNNPRFNSQITGGSTSIQAFWKPLRVIGASARMMLIQAAAKQWNVAPESITPQKSLLTGPNNQQATFGSLAKLASSVKVPENPVLKQAKDFKYIGHSRKRLDTAEKIDGSAIFGIDVQQPDLLIAAIAHAPVFDGELENADKTAALNVKGVKAIELVPHGVAVIAKDYWTAQQGLKSLNPVFNSAEVPITSSKKIYSQLSQTLDKEDSARFEDDASALYLEYQVPFLAHVTMEPMNCTAFVQAERCDIWAPTQGQTGAAEAAEKVTGLSKSKIFVHTTYLGGGFGRRGETDFVTEAVTLSKKLNKPVKVIWSREQDMQHDFYRPACISRFQIKLNNEGNPLAWHNQFAAPSIFKRIFARNVPDWIPLTRIIGDPVAKEGAKQPPYLTDNIEVEHHIVNMPVPVGFWRSVGHSYNAFFVESAIDELAHLNKTDPYSYRRRLLSKHPRLLAVLELAAKHANWGNSDYKQGIAVHQSFGSYVAQVVDLSIDQNKNMTLHRIVCAADCGTIVNPDSVIAQMQSAIIYGLSAALFAEITIDQGAVQQNNFDDYKVLRHNQCPLIDVFLIASDEAPGGAGEPGTPPIAPALTNAIFAASGERLRRLPITHNGYSIG